MIKGARSGSRRSAGRAKAGAGGRQKSGSRFNGEKVLGSLDKAEQVYYEESENCASETWAEREIGSATRRKFGVYCKGALSLPAGQARSRHRLALGMLRKRRQPEPAGEEPREDVQRAMQDASPILFSNDRGHADVRWHRAGSL